MQQQPGSNFNPYAPPTADIDQGLQLGDGQYELADPWSRLGASIIDNLLLVGALAPAGLIFLFTAGISSNVFDIAEREYISIGLIVLMGFMALAFVFYQWYLVATTGQSLAKRWMGLQIVRVDGSPLGFVNGVILRSWVITVIAQIPFIGGIVGLVDALMIFGAERRCLHDHIAGTRVIVAPRA